MGKVNNCILAVYWCSFILQDLSNLCTCRTGYLDGHAVWINFPALKKVFCHGVNFFTSPRHVVSLLDCCIFRKDGEKGWEEGKLYWEQTEELYEEGCLTEAVTFSEDGASSWHPAGRDLGDYTDYTDALNASFHSLPCELGPHTGQANQMPEGAAAVGACHRHPPPREQTE